MGVAWCPSHPLETAKERGKLLHEFKKICFSTYNNIAYCVYTLHTYCLRVDCF